MLDQIDVILGKGVVALDQVHAIYFERLKKMSRGEDSIKQQLLWLQHQRQSEDEEGKKSSRYLLKKVVEVKCAKGEEEGKLLEEAEELVALAHLTDFHRNHLYPVMLSQLCYLAQKHKQKTPLLALC